MPKNLSDKAMLFMAQKPTLIGSRQGYDFYEHPQYGDEVPLVCITKSGKKVSTAFYEMPDANEFEDFVSDLNRKTTKLV